MHLCDAALGCLAEREDWISTQIRTPEGANLRHGRFALGVGCGGTPVEGFAQRELVRSPHPCDRHPGDRSSDRRFRVGWGGVSLKSSQPGRRLEC